VTEREVVLDRIGWIEAPQGRRDVERHRPAGTGVPRQPQTAANANDVGIERHNETARRNARPHAEIERVAAHHPAKKQVQSLAAAACRGPRKEVAHARASAGRARDAAVRLSDIERERALGKTIERDTDIVARAIVSFSKEAFDRTVLADHLLEDPQQGDKVRPSRPAVHQILEPRRLASGIEVSDVRGRPIAHDDEQPFNRLKHARDASEGERGGAKSDDFAIVRPREPADKLNRICC